MSSLPLTTRRELLHVDLEPAEVAALQVRNTDVSSHPDRLPEPGREDVTVICRRAPGAPLQAARDRRGRAPRAHARGERLSRGGQRGTCSSNGVSNKDLVAQQR